MAIHINTLLEFLKKDIDTFFESYITNLKTITFANQTSEHNNSDKQNFVNSKVDKQLYSTYLHLVRGYYNFLTAYFKPNIYFQINSKLGEKSRRFIGDKALRLGKFISNVKVLGKEDFYINFLDQTHELISFIKKLDVINNHILEQYRGSKEFFDYFKNIDEFYSHVKESTITLVDYDFLSGENSLTPHPSLNKDIESLYNNEMGQDEILLFHNLYVKNGKILVKKFSCPTQPQEITLLKDQITKQILTKEDIWDNIHGHVIIKHDSYYEIRIFKYPYWQNGGHILLAPYEEELIVDAGELYFEKGTIMRIDKSGTFHKKVAANVATLGNEDMKCLSSLIYTLCDENITYDPKKHNCLSLKEIFANKKKFITSIKAEERMKYNSFLSDTALSKDPLKNEFYNDPKLL